jgi:glutaredoxin
MMVTIYSRPGCHLCDEMKATIERVVRRVNLDVRIDAVDISGDAALEAAYGTEIPVLIVDGKKAAKYRISDWELARLLQSKADQA